MKARWLLRVLLTVAGATTGAVEIAVLLARHYPDADGLNRLYAGLFLALASGITVLCWALFAPGWQHAARRACLWLLPLTAALLLWRGA